MMKTEIEESAPPHGSRAAGGRLHPACWAWRDPIADPPTMTGKILVWVPSVGPLLVNVEERWMSYWNGYDETEAASPDEWEAWAEINKPNDTSLARRASDSQ